MVFLLSVIISLKLEPSPTLALEGLRAEIFFYPSLCCSYTTGTWFLRNRSFLAKFFVFKKYSTFACVFTTTRTYVFWEYLRESGNVRIYWLFKRDQGRLVKMEVENLVTLSLLKQFLFTDFPETSAVEVVDLTNLSCPTCLSEQETYFTARRFPQEWEFQMYWLLGCCSGESIIPLAEDICWPIRVHYSSFGKYLQTNQSPLFLFRKISADQSEFIIPLSEDICRPFRVHYSSLGRYLLTNERPLFLFRKISADQSETIIPLLEDICWPFRVHYSSFGRYLLTIQRPLFLFRKISADQSESIIPLSEDICWPIRVHYSSF